jgi:hypothetical protein
MALDLNSNPRARYVPVKEIPVYIRIKDDNGCNVIRTTYN